MERKHAVGGPAERRVRFVGHQHDRVAVVKGALDLDQLGADARIAHQDQG